MLIDCRKVIDLGHSDVALAIGSQTTAIWLVFPEDLEEAAEMLAEK